MMINVDALKDLLITELWLPIAIEAGIGFYPKLRKNKKMRLLSLTNDRNFNEIVRFEENKLTQRENVAVWTKDTLKRIRLETESIDIVLGGSPYEQSILGNNCPLQEHFPRDIINLDFTSQDPDLGNGRIEKELESLEKTVKLQDQKQGKNFLLIYTTIIDSNNLNKGGVIQTSDSIRVNGWSGLNINNFSQPLLDESGKKTFIKEAIKRMCQKYGYKNSRSNNQGIDIPSRNEKLYSIVGIYMR